MSNDGWDFDKASAELEEILNEKTRQYLVQEGFPSDPEAVKMARAVIDQKMREKIPKIVDEFYAKGPIQKAIESRANSNREE